MAGEKPLLIFFSKSITAFTKNEYTRQNEKANDRFRVVKEVPGFRCPPAELKSKMAKKGIESPKGVARPESAGEKVVAFKDAATIKSWDAWSDHLAQTAVTSVLQNEKPCVTWRKLNAIDTGLQEIGRLATRTSPEVTSSTWSVGC